MRKGQGNPIRVSMICIPRRGLPRCGSIKGKEKYRGVFEIQRSGDKTSSEKIGLNIRTHASPKVGQDQVSGGVSVLCWHAAPVADTRMGFPCPFRNVVIDYFFLPRLVFFI